MLVALSFASFATAPAFAAQRGRDRGSQNRESRDRGQGDRGPSQSGARPAAPPAAGARQRSVSPSVGVAVPRQGPRTAPPTASRAFEPRTFAPAPRAVPRTLAPSAGAFARSYSRPFAPRVYVTPRPLYRAYYRPYYAFRPRVTLGFGIFIGYPVAYPYYYYPSAYPVPVPVAGPTGGLSFDITPTTAAIYVDGQYVGLVEDYSATMQPLSLAPGRHRVELREAGFAAIAFDADVIAGQVIPFQGAMEPQ